MTRTKMVPIPWSCEEWCLHWREHCTVTAITSLKREHSKKRKTESIPRWGRGLTFLQAWFLTFPNCNQHSKTLRKQIYSSSPNNPAFLPMLLSSATSTLSPLLLPHSCRLLLEESLDEETICVRTWNKELVGNHPALLKYKAWRGMFGFIQHFNQTSHMNFTKGRVHTLHVAELWRKRYLYIYFCTQRHRAAGPLHTARREQSCSVGTGHIKRCQVRRSYCKKISTAHIHLPYFTFLRLWLPSDAAQRRLSVQAGEAILMLLCFTLLTPISAK